MISTKCKKDPTKWHSWFAWYPVEVRKYNRGPSICTTTAWLTWVDAKMERGYINKWEYRIPPVLTDSERRVAGMSDERRT